MTELLWGPRQPSPWRAALSAWALQLYDGFVQHPWLLTSTVGRRLLGPNELGWMDRGVQVLRETGLNGGEQLDSVLVVTGHVRTIAQQAVSMPGGSEGTDVHLIASAITELLSTHADKFPGLAAAMATAGGSQNQGLEFGLNRILDGLEVLISQR